MSDLFPGRTMKKIMFSDNYFLFRAMRAFSSQVLILSL